MKEKLQEFMIELGEISSLFLAMSQSIFYCYDYDKDTTHLISVSELIDKKMGKLHENIERALQSWQDSQ